jgi:hypothetical protein
LIFFKKIILLIFEKSFFKAQTNQEKVGTKNVEFQQIESLKQRFNGLIYSQDKKKVHF